MNVEQGDDDLDEDDFEDGELDNDEDLFIIGNGRDLKDEYDNTVRHRSNAFVVRRNGDSAVAGNLEIKGVLRVAPAGDLPMDDFTTGPNPNPSLLNPGLRYDEPVIEE